MFMPLRIEHAERTGSLGPVGRLAHLEMPGQKPGRYPMGPGYGTNRERISAGGSPDAGKSQRGTERTRPSLASLRSAA